MADVMVQAIEIFSKGGPVMWPLLVLSVISVMLSVERGLFWLWTHRPGRRDWLEQVVERLRLHDRNGARALLARDRSVYARVLRQVLDQNPETISGIELVEANRHTFERFGATLSTIITASPLLGILGTVLGIIRSFDLLGQSGAVADISQVASGIAEALITTAFGLIVALLTLFPFMLFRAQAERCLGTIERLASVARLAGSSSGS